MCLCSLSLIEIITFFQPKYHRNTHFVSALLVSTVKLMQVSNKWLFLVISPLIVYPIRKKHRVTVRVSPHQWYNEMVLVLIHKWFMIRQVLNYFTPSTCEAGLHAHTTFNCIIYHSDLAALVDVFYFKNKTGDNSAYCWKLRAQ